MGPVQLLSRAQFCGQRVDRRPSCVQGPLTCSARRRAKLTRMRPISARAAKRTETETSSRLEKGFARLGGILFTGSRSAAWFLQFALCLLVPGVLVYIGLGAEFFCLLDSLAGKIDKIPPVQAGLSAIPPLAFLLWVFYPEVEDFPGTVPMSPEADGVWFDIALDKMAALGRQQDSAEGRSTSSGSPGSPSDLDDASLLTRFDKDLESRNRSAPDVLQALKDFGEHLTR